MSHFYGTLNGNRGQGTRCGSKKSGMTSKAASWSGAVSAYAYYDEDRKCDCVRIAFQNWHGHGGIDREHHVIYDGPIAPSMEEYSRDVTTRAQALQATAGGKRTPLDPLISASGCRECVYADGGGSACRDCPYGDNKKTA